MLQLPEQVVFRIFLNGILQGSDSSTSNAIDNDHTGVEIGFNDLGAAGDTFLDGIISNVRFIKGTALYTANFTPPTEPLTNVNNTTLLCCQSPSSATAAAVTPASITATGNPIASNFNPFNTDINTVRGQENNYAVVNPLTFRGNGSISNGNLTMGSNSSGDCSAAVTQTIPTDKKIYCEAIFDITAGHGNIVTIGCGNTHDPGAYEKPGFQAGSFGFNYGGDSSNTGAHDEGTRTSFSYGTGSDGDTMMWCVDLSAGLMWAGRNGTWVNNGNPAAGTGAVITGIPTTANNLRMSVDGGGTNRADMHYNFSQKPFKYAPPEGFEPLCSANLPALQK